MNKKWLFIFLGCLITSIGVIILKHSYIVTGGTAGLSLSLSYLTGSSFALVFFIVNLPFYIFSFIRMGVTFTLSTIASVTLLSCITMIDHWLPTFSIPSAVGAIIGGFIVGLGLSLVFINGSSLGGANILALFLQKRFGTNPGLVNFLFDFIVVTTSIYTVGLLRGVLSILSIFVTARVISYFKKEIAQGHVAKQKTESPQSA